MAMGLEVIALVAVVCYLLYYLGTRKHDYWKKRGVIGPKPLPFFGTHKDPLLSKISFSEFFRTQYEAFPGERFVGFLAGSRPALMVRDPDLIKQILTKDFEFFPDRAQAYHEEEDPISAHLFNIEGVRWKSLRIKLSPTFTSGKIKRMFPLMTDSSKELERVLDAPAARGEVVEMKDVLGRFATDIIGSCAFGVNCNSLRNPNAEFRQQGMKFFAASWINKLRVAVLLPFPKFALLHRLLRHSSLNKFFLGLIKESVDYREKNDVKRGDFVDLLIEIKHKGKIVDDEVDLIEDPFLHLPISTSSEELNFTDNLMAAQAFVFFAAGFETSSTTMSFCLLELAHNPDIQEKARVDVDAAIKKHGGLTYDALTNMSYLDKIVSETLRKYSPAAALIRKCIKPYRVPGSGLVLEPNTVVSIPVAGLHYDPDHYPDPERFDPERFSPEAKALRHHYTFLPFGEGPRICIGMRFGLVQTKLGLATLLSRYEFQPSPLSKYPIVYMKGSFVTANVDGCHVHIRNRPMS